MAPTKYAISSARSVNSTLLSTEIDWVAMRCAPSCSSRTHPPTCDSLYSLSVILKCFLDLVLRKGICSVVLKLLRSSTPCCPRSHLMRDSLHVGSERRSGRVQQLENPRTAPMTI